MTLRKRENENTFFFVVRWTARLTSLAVLILLVLFFFGEGSDGPRPSGTEYVGLVFFPVGIAMGFVIGWVNEAVGGSISVASLAGFYLIYGLIMTGSVPQGVFFLLFTIPGFLFLLYGVYRNSPPRGIHTFGSQHAHKGFK